MPDDGLYRGRLLKAGFQSAGLWKIEDDGDPVKLSLGNAAMTKSPGVYAHLVDGKVHYVGSSQSGLDKRLRNYQISKSMKTAARVRSLIVTALRKGQKVEMMIVMLDEALPDWKGLPINFISGLEDGLIRAITPEWNKRGIGVSKKKPKKVKSVVIGA